MIPMYSKSTEAVACLFRSDWVVTCVLFLCLLAIPVVFVRTKRRLCRDLGLDIWSRGRNDISDGVTMSDVRYTLLLIFHSCLMLAFVACLLFVPSSLVDVSPSLWLGGMLLCFLLFFIVKWIVYLSVNSVFFQKDGILSWKVAFVNVFICLGILLFPLILLVVFSNLPSRSLMFLIVGILFLAKFVLFWKCFSIFFKKIHGVFHLILYFCALEILPDLILWKGMVLANNNLILNI